MSKSIHHDEPLTYQSSGVNIEKANALIGNIKTIAKRTHRPGVMASIGGFGALFELPLNQYKEPILVSGTDGVGTKLKLALALNQHDTIGIDLVAMCANDIVTLGAEPLFFLDYFATGHLNPSQAHDIIKGIGQGCELAGAALIGGETAEMPGMYHGQDYDLAGFCVGIVEKSKMIDASQVKAGDVLIGLASSGVHSNGFSLIRKVIEKAQASFDTPLADSTLGETLLTPTRLYVKSVLSLCQQLPIHALAHITGGGLLENIPRVLPAHTQAIIESSSWQWPDIFRWIQTRGNISNEEMYRTFNVGVGMVVCVSKEDEKQALDSLNQSGETAWRIGHIDAFNEQQPAVTIQSS